MKAQSLLLFNFQIEKGRRRRMKIPNANTKCAMCGCELINVYPTTKYCPTCREIKRKENYLHPQSYRRYKVEQERFQRMKMNGEMKMTIDDITREAAAEGLSYGQYCAKYGL